ncbi:uncharacterized protein LOC135488964 [Lineus longissimus]|uniref:uncharacterized protein LOC135488964 n=1 Tax=Lineus longissimus TaxID=88925 RepID=UPI002B4E31CB
MDRGYFVVILLLSVTRSKVYGQDFEGCVGPYPPPVFHDYSFTDRPLVVEAKVSSAYPVSVNWHVRYWYEDWPKSRALYYYIPENGDDQFQVYQQKSGNATLVRITAETMENAPKNLGLQILVHNPCTTIEYIVNTATIGRIFNGAIHFPVMTKVPAPEYVVQPGEFLSVPFGAKANPVAYSVYEYGRHIRREGDRLTVQQRLENNGAMPYTAQNVRYSPSSNTNDDRTKTWGVSMDFKPWSEADSGVFVATRFSAYFYLLPSSDPHKYYISYRIRAFFDVRSRQVATPALTVYNELDFLYRGQPFQESNGNYLIPLPRTLKWAQSIRCIAHASNNPVIQTSMFFPKNATWQTFENTSTIIGTKTVASDAFAVDGTYRKYKCKARAGGREATLTFATIWFTPFKLVSREPKLSWLDKEPFTVTCTGRGEPRVADQFARFYLLNATFRYYPNSRDYFVQHRIDEVTASTPGTSLSVDYIPDQGKVTGRLEVLDANALKGKKCLMCVVGDRYSFDYHRYWMS